MASGGYWNWGAVNPRTNYEVYYASGPAGNGSNSTNTAAWNATPSTGTDPCRLGLGSPWRLPAEQDLTDLINSGNTRGVYASSGGGSGVYGGWFGTTTVPTTDAERIQYVFLPAAGMRNNWNEEVRSAGSSGIYWSSTQGADPDHALLIDIESDNAYPGDDYKKSGFSLRCARDDN
jgi:uncharacterized protein (TIGR02145 family)